MYTYFSGAKQNDRRFDYGGILFLNYTFPASFATSMAASKHLSRFTSDMAAVDTFLVSPHRKDTALSDTLATDLKRMHAGNVARFAGSARLRLVQNSY